MQMLQTHDEAERNAERDEWQHMLLERFEALQQKLDAKEKAGKVICNKVC